MTAVIVSAMVLAALIFYLAVKPRHGYYIEPGELARDVDRLLKEQRRREKEKASDEYEQNLESEFKKQCPDLADQWPGHSGLARSQKLR